MTDLVVKKLEEAFALGCTDLEACFYADITKQTLYTYQQTHDEFLDRKELLKQRPVLEARKSVIRHLESDGKLAIRYLERKLSNEFSLRTQVEVNPESERLRTVRSMSMEEIEDKLADSLSGSSRYSVVLRSQHDNQL
jgi:hypothetical protein